MLKSKPIVLLTSLLLLFGIGGLWLLVIPNITASVSNATYQQDTYDYTVEIDTVFNTDSQSLEEEGILVSIHPDYSQDNASAFSQTYLDAGRERTAQWLVKREANTLADVMIVFSHPLTLEEANKVLQSSKSDVFESGLVGYIDGVPFAHYMQEGEVSLVQSLQDVANTLAGFESETTIDVVSETEPHVDVRGYLAVRAWTPVESLEMLSSHESVRFVDTTPQEVRDQLATDKNWQNMPVNAIAIEMPVWAFDW